MSRLALPTLAALAAAAAVAVGAGGQEPPAPEAVLPTHLGIGLATGKADGHEQGAKRAVKRYLAPLLTDVNHGAPVRLRHCGRRRFGPGGFGYRRCLVHVAGPRTRCRAIVQVRISHGAYRAQATRLRCQS